MENPFFTHEDAEAYELPALPFIVAGDAARLQYAADLSQWLYEIGYVGSDECVANAAAVFEPLQEALREYGEAWGIDPSPYDSNGAELDFTSPSPRELVVGTAAVYGWQDSW